MHYFVNKALKEGPIWVPQFIESQHRAHCIITVKRMPKKPVSVLNFHDRRDSRVVIQEAVKRNGIVCVEIYWIV